MNDNRPDTKDRKKLLKEQYKSRTITGGIYRIVNQETGRFYLRLANEMQSVRNWFEGCQSSGIVGHPTLGDDWAKYGPAAFVLEELELLEKTPEQTSREFNQDLNLLYQIWDEKLPADNRY